jgi:cysteine-rich repeat protein
VLDADEQCDDGDQTNGDGCNNDCVISGSEVWSHTHASGTGVDAGRAVVVNESRDAFVVGQVRTPTGTADIWLRRYTVEGGLDWTRTLDGGLDANDVGFGIARADDALYLAASMAAPEGGTDAAYARYDLSGTLVWQLGDVGPVLGGSDAALAVAVDPAGYPIVVGHQTVQGQGINAWIRKLDPAGNALWTVSSDGPVNGDDRANAVATDFDGNIVVAGWQTGAAGNRDIWIHKIDPDGAEVWTVIVDGAEALNDAAHGVAIDDDGAIVVAGFEGTSVPSPSQWWVGKFDAAGAPLWTVTDAGTTGEGAQARGIAIGPGGDIAVVGNELDGGFHRVLVRKYSAGGAERWTNTFDGASMADDIGHGVVLDDVGRAYAVGRLDKGIDSGDAWIVRLAQ